MTATLTQRPTRRLRQLRLIAETSRHLDHFRVHLEDQILALPPEAPLWDGGQVSVTLGGPWKGRDRDRVLTAWGVPLVMHDLPALVHLPEGGWGAFEIPPMPDVYAFMVKSSKHPEAVVYLDLLAHVLLFSRLTLSEAFSTAMDCVRLDPMVDRWPQLRVNDWARFGAAVVNVWEARTNAGAHLGDLERIARLMHELMGLLNGWSIRQAELDLDERRTRFGGTS